MRTALTLPLLTVLALPVTAGAASFSPPEGCTLDLTVQNRGCVVANYYTCAKDAAGDRWSAFADRDGIFYVTRIDAETRWMESFSPVSGVTDRLLPDAHDHASFSTLIATGRDDFDFATVDSNGEVRRYSGFDRLTGAVREVNGITLEETEFEVRTRDSSGTELSRRSGREYISRTQRLFFGGTDTTHEPGLPEVFSVNDPVSLSLPGQPGFAEAKPHYDCDLLMTGAPKGEAG